MKKVYVFTRTEEQSHEDVEFYVDRVLVAPEDMDVDIAALQTEFRANFRDFATWLINFKGFEEANVLGQEDV